MSCPICHRSILRKIKSISKVNIYQCDRCLLAILDKQKITKDKLYSFKNYQTQEKKLERRLINLGKIIIRFVKEGKILDVGAGFGQFSAILNKLGKYKIEVIEPVVKTKYLKHIKHKLYRNNYENYLLSLPECKRHDLILMMDVLEHFRNPLKILRDTKKILSKNGYLVVQTPNYRSLMAKLCKNWSWWMVEDHKFVFSPNSIRLILQKAGYKIVYFKTYEDLYDLKKNLDGNFNNKFSKGIFYLIFFPLYLIFRKIVWHFGYGGAIFLIAKQYNKYQ